MTFSSIAPRLQSLGYEVIPIPAGEKGPKIKDWQSIEITASRVAAWAREYPTGNVGVRTKLTPAIDVDVTDAAFAQEIEAILSREGLATCVRVGSAPKRLLVCRADQPFRKTVLKLVAPDGSKHAVEVLGLGQQFVAYGKHPKGHDYTWTSLDELDATPVSELPLLTPEIVLEIFSRIEAAAIRLGWSAKRVGAPSRATVDDDALMAFSPAVTDITDEQVDEALSLFSNDDVDYDTFLNVGMALHHQYAGRLEGLSKWHEWASRSGKYVPETCDAKWQSFHQRPASATPITFRYVLKYASEGKAAKKRERMDEIRAEIAGVLSAEKLYGQVASRVGKLLENEIEVDLVVDAILKRGKELGETPSKQTVRKAVKLAYLSTRVNTNCPDWLKPWCYIEQTEQFYNLHTGQVLSERAFNSVHDRLLLSEAERAAGQFIPEYRAATVALNKFEVETLQNFRYMPGAQCVFEIEGVKYANTYTTRAVPAIPDEYTAGDREAIDAFRSHLDLLFEDRASGRILLDWLAWKAQNLGDHPHWAILVQGAEGGGKSFFSEVMAGVLGVENVGNVSPSALRSDFTGWAEGKVLVIVEEIRLHGENRFAVIDKVKPYVTNSIVPIRRMRTDEYSIPNVTAYLLFTNHDDALPLAKMDRRFCVLRTVFQTGESVLSFREKNADYFDRLFDLIRSHKGALRRFLLEHEVSPEFRPYGHAPFTDAKQLMIDSARGDEADGLEALIEGSTDPMVNEYVLNVSRLKEMAAQQMVMMPESTKLAAALRHLGFEFVGRARDAEGVQARYWTKRGTVVKVPNFQTWLTTYLSDPFA